MKITRNVIPISDLYTWLAAKSLEINRDYQRGAGLWPTTARSYFIDTILNEYPFPKVTIRQIIDLKTSRSKREVVDGQQRLLTIKDFIDGNLTLTSVSKKYAGRKFSQLEEEDRESFLSYEVSVDTITVGTNEEVLEIFRRMNSYTLPLNDAEKRHAIYQGRFKWFILELLDDYSSFFEQAKILTIKDIGRMKDADLMTELAQIAIDGLADRAPKKLDALYKKYDTIEDVFQNEEKYGRIVRETLDYMKNKLATLFVNDQIPAYFFYSLFSALVFNRFGLNNVTSESIGVNSIGEYSNNPQKSAQTILDMLREADEKNLHGRYKEFVAACVSSTQRIVNRRIRLYWLAKALQE